MQPINSLKSCVVSSQNARKLVYLVTLCGLSLQMPVANAQVEIYRCEGESGVPLYQNAPGKNCRKLDLQPLTTIPAPKSLPAARVSTVSSNGAAPGNFPRVESSAQQQRDTDRRKILEDELKKEEARLADLRKEFNGGEPERRSDERNFEKYQGRIQKMKEDMARTEANIGSIRREIGMIRS